MCMTTQPAIILQKTNVVLMTLLADAKYRDCRDGVKQIILFQLPRDSTCDCADLRPRYF